MTQVGSNLAHRFISGRQSVKVPDWLLPTRYGVMFWVCVLPCSSLPHHCALQRPITKTTTKTVEDCSRRVQHITIFHNLSFKTVKRYRVHLTYQMIITQRPYVLQVSKMGVFFRKRLVHLAAFPETQKMHILIVRPFAMR